jgi:hypothetical protein
MAAPDMLQQFVLADDVFAVPHQMEKQVEDLRIDGNRLGATREFPKLGVEHVVLKREPQVPSQRPCPIDAPGTAGPGGSLDE